MDSFPVYIKFNNPNKQFSIMAYQMDIPYYMLIPTHVFPFLDHQWEIVMDYIVVFHFAIQKYKD